MINFNPLQSAFEVKIVFLEFKTLRAHKKLYHVSYLQKGYLWMYGKREKSILLLLPPNLNFVCF